MKSPAALGGAFQSASAPPGADLHSATRRSRAAPPAAEMRNSHGAGPLMPDRNCLMIPDGRCPFHDALRTRDLPREARLYQDGRALGEKAREVAGHAYLIQKHAASRLHYDFRLELGGVLKSWAVTRGPSLNPEDKRLAVHVEDHPLDYGSFEGTIPQGQYGGGTVMLWDHGTWEPIGNPERDLARGNLTFILHGKRLKGRWHLVRLRGKRPGDTKRENWLLIKGKDEYADANGDAATEKFQKSVVSGRGMEGIARGSGKSWGKTGARKKSTAEAVDAVKALKKKERAAPARHVKPAPRRQG